MTTRLSSRDTSFAQVIRVEKKNGDVYWIEIVIDTARIAHIIGRRAIGNKSKKASAVYGGVQVNVLTSQRNK